MIPSCSAIRNDGWSAEESATFEVEFTYGKFSPLEVRFLLFEEVSMTASQVFQAFKLITVVALGAAQAAWSQESPCAMVYRDNIRNLSFSTSSLSELNTLFEHHCQANGTARAFDTSGGMTLPIDVPIEFTGSASASEERTKNFCRSVAELRSNNQQMMNFQSAPLVAALRSFNDCRVLEVEQKVTITHKWTTDSLAVSVSIPKNTVFRVDGVNSQNLECRASGIPDVSGQLLGPETVFEARTDFGILCTRASDTSPIGSQIRPGSMTMVTGYGLSYSAEAAGDILYTADQASLSSQTIQALNTSLQESRAELAVLREFRTRVENLRMLLVGFSTGWNGWGYGATRNDFPGLSADPIILDRWVRERCYDLAGPGNGMAEPDRVAIINGPKAEHEQSWFIACIDY